MHGWRLVFCSSMSPNLILAMFPETKRDRAFSAGLVFVRDSQGDFLIFRFFFAPSDSDFQILSKPYIIGNIIYSNDV